MAKVITVFPVNRPDASGHWIIEGFKEAGHEVVDNIDHRGKNCKNPKADLLNSIRTNKPDFVLITKTNKFNGIYDDIKKMCKLVAMNVDGRTGIYHWRHLFPLIEASDAYFVCEYGLISDYKDRFGDKIHFLPTACSKMNKRLEWNKSDCDTYSADVSFIGSVDPFHGTYRRDIMQAVRRKYGDGFKWYGPGSTLGYAGNDVFNKVCSFSKIVLGCNFLPQMDSYVSRRDFMILGSGGFLMSNLTKNSQRLMVDGEHYVSYASMGELLNKIELYLVEDGERERIRANGYKHAHLNHRWRNRAETICKTLGF